MRRSILFSLLIIGAVVTVIGVAGTQAVFTDSQEVNGDVNAATIDLYIDDVTGADDAGEDDNIFNAAAENLLPGNTASWVVRLRNPGSAPWDLTGADSTGSLGLECDADNVGPDFTIATVGVADHGSDNHVGPIIHVAPTGAEDVRVDVTLAAGVDNDCQGAIANVNVVFTVSQH